MCSTIYFAVIKLFASLAFLQSLIPIYSRVKYTGIGTVADFYNELLLYVVGLLKWATC